MILDQAISLVAILALCFAFTARAGIALALVVLLSHSYNVAALTVIDNSNWNVYFASLKDWLYIIFIKDLLLLTLFGLRRNPRELIILLSFAVSCLFHQGILAQVLTYESKNLTLFAIRPQFMLYVSVAQLATVFYIILTGSGINGGKRKCAERNILDFHHNLNRVFHVQAFKVKR